MSKLVNYVMEKCRELSRQKEVEGINSQISVLKEKAEKLQGNIAATVEVINSEISVLKEKAERLQGNIAATNGSGKKNDSKKKESSKLVNCSYHISFDNVKRYMLKNDNMSNTVTYLIHNNYDSVIIDVARNLSVNVYEDNKLQSVKGIVRSFLIRAKKHNARELSQDESNFLVNHLAVFYAIKNGIKKHNKTYYIRANKEVNETLLSYAQYRRKNIEDVYV